MTTRTTRRPRLPFAAFLCGTALALGAQSTPAHAVRATDGVDVPGGTADLVVESARSHRFGQSVVTRTTYARAGARIEGRTAIELERGGQRTVVQSMDGLSYAGQHMLGNAAATLAAHHGRGGTLIRDATVERTDGLSRPVWLVRGDVATAAYRVRVPTMNIYALRDVWVHGETGAVLMESPVAHFQTMLGSEVPSRVFEYQPGPDADPADLQDVMLHDLLPAEVGSHVRGAHMETYNCCKHYTCSDGSDACEPADRVCADEGDEGAIESRIDVDLPVDLLGFDLSQFGFNGDTLYISSVFCTEQPRLMSTEATEDQPAGFFAAPVDGTSLDAEIDAFAEAQVYHATERFFDHVRGVLEDPAFCLGGQSMTCEDDGSPILGVDGKPERPFHIATNVLFPNFDLQGLGLQLFGGKGASPDNRITIDSYMRQPNAVFLPALEGGGIQLPPQLGELANQFNRPYDSNMYFQGQRDFAYDGDVVRHEFTHALVHAFVPTLRSIAADQWGAHAWPGSLNEGWADFFSASFNGDPETGEYSAREITGGETGLRTADNDDACPTNLIAEVHQDSLPFSGALWELRAAVLDAEGETGVRRLEQALLLALSQSADNETPDMQLPRIVAAVRDAFGDSIADAAQSAFERHNIADCARIWPLGENGDGGFTTNAMADLFVPSAQEAGLEGFAPALVQFQLELPANTTGATIRFNAAGASQLGFGGGEAPTVSAIVNDGPIVWTYGGAGGATPLPTNEAGDPVLFDPAADESVAVIGEPNQQTGVAAGKFELAVDNCDAHTVVVQFVTTGAGGRLSDIRAEIESGDDCSGAGETDAGNGGELGGGGEDTPAESCGCSAETPANPAWFGLAALLGLLRRRKKD